MKINDIGELSRDIVLFGGIYSNLQAFRSFLEWLDAAGIRAQNCICTGDIVAYCAHPAEVTALMIETGIRSIAGNCEKQLASGAEDCGCGFDEGTACDIASKGWFAFAKQRTEAYKSHFADLPDILTFTAFGKKYAVIHGGVSNISTFLWPVSETEGFRTEIKVLEGLVGPIDGVVCGHSGIAFERHIDDKIWINSGVLGMPPHDGRPQTRFAVLSADGVRFHHLEYPAGEAAKDLKAAGFDAGYERSLVSGIWPSEDVLPKQLRR